MAVDYRLVLDMTNRVTEVYRKFQGVSRENSTSKNYLVCVDFLQNPATQGKRDKQMSPCDFSNILTVVIFLHIGKTGKVFPIQVILLCRNQIMTPTIIELNHHSYGMGDIKSHLPTR